MNSGKSECSSPVSSVSAQVGAKVSDAPKPSTLNPTQAVWTPLLWISTAADDDRAAGRDQGSRTLAMTKLTCMSETLADRTPCEWPCPTNGAALPDGFLSFMSVCSLGASLAMPSACGRASLSMKSQVDRCRLSSRCSQFNPCSRW